MSRMQLARQVTARRNGDGFETLEKWLGEDDRLFLRWNNAAPLALMLWQACVRLVTWGR